MFSLATTLLNQVGIMGGGMRGLVARCGSTHGGGTRCRAFRIGSRGLRWPLLKQRRTRMPRTTSGVPRIALVNFNFAVRCASGGGV